MDTIEKKRRLILMLLFTCGVINYLDRSALSIAATSVAGEFALSSAEMGIIFSAFSLGYALFNVVGGVAADKFGPKDTLLIAVIVWSLFSGALIFAAGFISILIIRVIFGMSEGPLQTTANKTIDMWYPDDKKTSMMGLTSSGTPLGAAISGPIVGYITVAYGWRESFIVITLIGLVWAVAWFKLVDKKPQKIEDKDKSVIEKVSTTKIRVPLKRSFYLKNPTIIFTALGFFAYTYILFFFLSWLPVYLTTGLNIDLADVGLINLIPWTLGFVALAMGGICADKITGMKKWKDPIFPKKMIISIGLLISGIATIIVANTTNFTLIISMIALSVVAMYFTGGIFWGIINDIVDSSNVGSIGGFMHAVGNCAGILGPSITGFILQGTGSFIPVFVITGIIGIIGGLGALLKIKKITLTEKELVIFGKDILKKNKLEKFGKNTDLV